MKKLIFSSALFMSFLIVMLPVCFADSLSLTYDDNGNLVTGDGFYREYNSLNQLWKVYNGSDTTLLLEEYTMHPTEERVLIKKVYNNSGDLKETVYYVNDEFVRVINGSGTFDTTYVKHNGQRVAELRPDGTKIFIHSDHLGSTSLTSDESGNAVDNTSYSPFGMIIDGDNVSRYSYEGKEYDSVIDQYDFHFRGYKASWGKFTQPDTILENVYDPQMLNRYAFERNNPWKYTDDDGHAIQFLAIAGALLKKAAIGAAIGAAGGAALEASVQLVFAGEIYSKERIKYAAKEGAIIGGAMGLLGPGSGIPALALTADFIKGSKTVLLDLPNSIKEAKCYKASKELLEEDEAGDSVAEIEQGDKDEELQQQQTLNTDTGGTNRGKKGKTYWIITETEDSITWTKVTT